MFATTLILLLAGLAVASPLKRAPGLVVSLSAVESTIESIDNIALVATVENTSSDDIKVIKYGTVLDSELPTRSFIVSKGDSELSFTGVKVQISVPDLSSDSYIVIPAGQSVSATHTNLATLYDFAAVGTGTFSFTPKHEFQVAGADDIVQNIADTLTVSAISAATVHVDIVTDVKKRDLKVLDKRAVVSCSASTQASFISSSYTEGKALASLAANYITTNGANSTLFKAYFGAQSIATPLSVLNNVANENSSTRTLGCSDPYAVCDGNVIAYTVIATTNIYFCNIFYNEVATTSLCTGTTIASRNIRGGTVLHEITHATSDTDDIGYGCAYDKNLAISSPSRAAINADNYNCFATEIYASSQCQTS
ncbi:hypothetical protein M408DRAFT_68091 [Serendipita vermifera MAFF 305830]|uniref:deuterolysin n=1 Tax=Serendipita vermifera MAFF 305830 TaxID=933852 RepID=A0A0C3BAY3_SERVB|nr:hypothetical protein M408DRAFT_68091 [Serendipita vermifera MAFF 305830]